MVAPGDLLEGFLLHVQIQPQIRLLPDELLLDVRRFRSAGAACKVAALTTPPLEIAGAPPDAAAPILKRTSRPENLNSPTHA